MTASHAIGSNNPPEPISPIDEARPVYALAAEFLKANPVILDEAVALKANETLAIAKNSTNALDAAKHAESDPHYQQWQIVLKHYKPALDSLKRVIDELSVRLSEFMAREEVRRHREATEAKAVAEEAERLAREAEAAEAEIRDDVAQGEIGLDVVAATEAADTAFSDYERAERAAGIAQKATQVRLKSRFGAKATTLKSKEVLNLANWRNAIADMGISDELQECIFKQARAFRKEHSRLPDGVTSEMERRL